VAQNLSAGRMPVREAKAKGDDVARSRQFEWLARAGLVARGVIYAIIGVLAIKLALGDGGKTTNQQGALETIAKQPFGKALLILMAVGLAGYATWRLVRAALGHGPEASDDTKERLDGFVSGIGYALLCVTAVSILIGSGSGGSGGPDKATGGVLGWPAGQILVGLAGLIIVGVGLEQGYKGIKKKFLEDSKTEQMSERVERFVTALGIFGHLARMVVFGLVGYFLVRAAIDYDADKAIGVDGALNKLAHASYGPVLLGIVAAGLIGFAAYSVVDARYRKV
jgi:H+/Cl- antiporter ClcA